MTDKLTDVVRLLYAERYGRSSWWRRTIVDPREQRRRLLAALDDIEKERQASE